MNARAATWTRILVATAVVAVIMAISGSFGSGILSIAPRAAYWFGLSAVGITIGNASARIVPQRWFESRPWLAWSVIAAFVGAPMTALVTLTTVLLFIAPSA